MAKVYFSDLIEHSGTHVELAHFAKALRVWTEALAEFGFEGAVHCLLSAHIHYNPVGTL